VGTSLSLSGWKRIAVRTVGGLLLFWIAFCGFVFWSMRQPPETFARVMSHMPGPVVFLVAPFETMWMQARAGHLKPGDPAPDFNLVKLDKSDRVQLSALHQPVILIFGSYT